MSRWLRFWISVASALAVLALLIWLTFAAPLDGNNLVPGILFLVLIVYTTTFGIPLAGGRASLLPMATAAAYLVMGLVPAAWAAFVGALLHGWIRYQWAEPLEEQLEPGIQAPVGTASANAMLHTLSILAAGAVFEAAGGTTPLTEVNASNTLPLLLLGITYIGTNLLIAGAYFAMRSLEVLKLYLGSLHTVLLTEAWPLIFSPFMALTYTQLGLVQFGLLALAIVVISLVTRRLALTSQRLGRRVKELDSLQAVGQALSASLALEVILPAIHAEVARLMPAHNFYVALYDPEADEVSFPLAIEDGERVRWRSRRMGNGLTEFVLRTQKPLLIRKDYQATLETLEIDRIGRIAASWLGVPILAGDNPLGVIAVQSYSPRQVYDIPHQNVLVTLAAQAAVAIQNARLYAQTDEALTRRVQEQDSILRTTQEGILLLDPRYRVLAANRALADFLGIARQELTAEGLFTPGQDGEPSLASIIGYTAEGLEAECKAIARGHEELVDGELVIPRPQERYLRRTLAPVRDPRGEISGWLLVFRDLTEERELARLRDELTQMLVHDLRSPMTVLTSSLELMRGDLEVGNTASFDDLIRLAEQSSDHVLHLINDLLDIGRLEGGLMAIKPDPVDVEPVLKTVAARLAPLAAQARIGLEISAESRLPPLYADAEILDRVIHNLVDNAIKFTPDGGRVQLWTRLGQDGRATVLVGVTDTGPGIPANVRAQLFQKFQQVETTPGRRRGAGLGLPFCKLALEAHGGEIWVESEVGQGSTFVTRWPVAGGARLSTTDTRSLRQGGVL